MLVLPSMWVAWIRDVLKPFFRSARTSWITFVRSFVRSSARPPVRKNPTQQPSFESVSGHHDSLDYKLA